jgi:hypothetical protein
MASVMMRAASPVSPRVLITSLARSVLPTAKKPTAALSTSNRGKSDRKADSVTAEAR